MPAWSFPRTSVRRHLLALVAGHAIACDKPKPPAPTPPPVVVEAPSDLLVDGVVANPKQTWGKILREAGPASLLLPESAASVIANLAGLEGASGAGTPIVDDTGIARVIVVGEKAAPAPLLAVLVPRGVDVASQLFGGDVARATPKDAGAFVVAVPKGGDTGVVSAFGRHGGASHLLLGPSAQTIEHAGAFAMGGAMPCVTGAHEACARIEGRAFRLLGSRAQERFRSLRADLEKADAESRAAHGGKEPDFGDPAAILSFGDAAVAHFVGLLGDVKSAETTLDIDGPIVRTHTEIVPSAAGALVSRVAALHAGPKTAALELPFDIDAALVTHAFPDGKPEDLAKELVDDGLRKILGARIDDAGATSLRALVAAVLGDLAPPLAIGVMRSPAPALVFSASLKNGTAGFLPEGLVRVLQLPALAGPLGLAGASAKPLDVKDAARAGRIEIRRSKGPKSKGPAGLEITWAIARDRLFVAFSASAAGPLAHFVSKERTLDGEPLLRAEIERLPASVSSLVVLRPQRLDPSRVGSLAAPALLGLSKHDGAVVIDVSVGSQVLRELLRQRTSL